jgi:hypothetical protein
MSEQGAKHRHVLGLDLGQAADYTALVSLEVHPNPYGLQTVAPSPHYVVDYAYRWPLKTDYDVIIEEVAGLLTLPQVGERPVLAVDQTGVGKPVVDLLRAANLTISPRQSPREGRTSRVSRRSSRSADRRSLRSYSASRIEPRYRRPASKQSFSSR